MVTSINALRTHILMTYGKERVLRMTRNRFDNDELLVDLKIGTALSPKDAKFYNAHLIEHSINSDRFSYRLTMNTTPQRKFKIPKKYAACLRVLQANSDWFEVKRTEHFTDVNSQNMSEFYRGRPLPSLNLTFGTYDTIFVLPKTPEAKELLLERADFIAYPDEPEESYVVCFLRRYRVQGEDSKVQKNDYIKSQCISHLIHLMADNVPKSFGSLTEWVNTPTAATKRVQEKCAFEFNSWSEVIDLLKKTGGKNAIW